MRLSDYVDSEYSTLGQLAKAFDWARKPETKAAILKRIYSGADERREQEQFREHRALMKRLDPVMLQAVDSLYPWHMQVIRRVRRWWAR